MSEFDGIRSRALQGNLERRPRSSLAAQAVRPRPARRCCSTTDSFVEDGLLANALADDLPADGVVTGVGRVDGRPVCVMANDPTVKAGSWGARTVEKIVRLTEYALRHELPVVLARRLRRRPHHRPGRAVPRPARRGPHLRQPGAAVGQGAAGVLPVRPVGRGRRVHPGVLRRRVHGRGQRVDVPRLAAHGRDGDRREGDARGDGRRPHARHRVRAAATTSPSTTPTRSTQAKRWFSYLPDARGASDAAALRAAPQPIATARPRRCVPERGAPRLRHAQRDRRRSSTPDSFFEVKPLFAPELIIGFARLDGQPVGIVANNPMHQGRRAVRRLGRQGGPLHLAVRRVQRPAGVPRRRARLHDRHRRSSGRASSATAPR